MTEEVTQADREAAAALWEFFKSQGPIIGTPEAGRAIGREFVDAFRRHRLAHLPTDLSDDSGERRQAIRAEHGLTSRDLGDRALASAIDRAMQQYAAGLQGEVEEAKREATKWRRAANDRDYMINAIVPMLGPVAREVWDGWRESGIQRIHFSLGPEGENLRGEEMASMIRDFQNAPCERIDNIDGDFPTRTSLGDTQ